MLPHVVSFHLRAYRIHSETWRMMFGNNEYFKIEEEATVENSTNRSPLDDQNFKVKGEGFFSSLGPNRGHVQKTQIETLCTFALPN